LATNIKKIRPKIQQFLAAVKSILGCLSALFHTITSFEINQLEIRMSKPEMRNKSEIKISNDETFPLPKQQICLFASFLAMKFKQVSI